MRKLFVTVMAVVMVVVISACSHFQHQKDNGEVGDLELVISSLLNENTKKYTYKNANGDLMFDELKEFKALEAIYIKNMNLFESNNVLTASQLKTIMFFAFYSIEKNSAAFQEYLASDLMLVYLKNKNSFLKILQDSPFLTQTNCNRLNAYFGFEGINQNKKELFLKENETQFNQNLKTEQFHFCWSQFE